MSLNDKAAAALKRELVRAFPERGENDAGHDRLAEALSKPEHPACSFCRERHEPSRKFGYTRHGVSSCDMYSSRVAAFSKNLTDDQRRTLGPLFAAAPELLEALKEAERVIRWAAQEACGRVEKSIVGGWVHHADKISCTIARAEGGAK